MIANWKTSSFQVRKKLKLDIWTINIECDFRYWILEDLTTHLWFLLFLSWRIQSHKTFFEWRWIQAQTNQQYRTKNRRIQDKIDGNDHRKAANNKWKSISIYKQVHINNESLYIYTWIVWYNFCFKLREDIEKLQSTLIEGNQTKMKIQDELDIVKLKQERDEQSLINYQLKLERVRKLNSSIVTRLIWVCFLVG